MIKKLLNSEYLPSIEQMTEEEKSAYKKRVGEWLRSNGTRLLELTDRPMAKAQNIMLLSARWSKDDSNTVHEGIRLMSALMDITDTWLPSVLWTKSGWRVVRQIVNTLSEVGNDNKKAEKASDIPTVGTQATKANSEKKKDIKVQAEVQTKATTPAEKPQSTVVKKAGIPVRPRHIDQYVHLLPQKTQERASQYGPLMREMDEARENLRLLMKDPEASASHRESWAKKVTKIDATLGAIRRELDTEWERLVEEGRVVVDDLGQAHIVEAKSEGIKEESESNHESSHVTPESEKSEQKPMTEEDSATKEAESEEKQKQEQMRQAGLIRKWLIDTRNADTDEQKEKWIQKYREMVAIGGEKTVTKKVLEAAAFYGINLEGEKKVD